MKHLQTCDSPAHAEVCEYVAQRGRRNTQRRAVWHRRVVVTHKSLFAGIFIYGRRAFGRVAETQPWKHRLNFQTISLQQRR